MAPQFGSFAGSWSFASALAGKGVGLSVDPNDGIPTSVREDLVRILGIALEIEAGAASTQRF
jgi:hypothetical protein